MSQATTNSTVFNTFLANVDEQVQKFKPIISTGTAATKATITITKTTTTTLRTTKSEAITTPTTTATPKRTPAATTAAATATAAGAITPNDAARAAAATIAFAAAAAATATAAIAARAAASHELSADDIIMTGELSGTKANANANNGNVITLSTESSTGASASPPNGAGAAHSSTYKIVKTLGKGNFAKVKLALHIPTGREVAIKIIDKTMLNSSAQQKLHREVGIMKMLNHPNIVRLYQVIETERTLYLVMEYACRGELFDHLVKNGRMKERDARTVFRQLVSAVQYCHSKFVVHRDLKAENLLLDQRMNIKIADFGFGNTFDPKSHLETFCGSPPYAAPELFMGRKYAGPEADAWSLGVVLYTLVSGTLPFDGGTLKELRERVLRGKYRVPYYISMDCENLMRKFLVLNPTKRSTLSAVMADKWLNTGYDEADWLRPFRESPLLLNDPARMEQLMDMGYKRREIEHSLQKQRFDDIFCTYVLLGMPRSRRHDPAIAAVGGVKLHAKSRPVAPRMANGQQPAATTSASATCSVEPQLGLPPAKPTRRSICKSPAPAVHARVDTGLAHKLLPTASAAPSPKRFNAIDVKPTLLSTQRQFAQQQQQQHKHNTPTKGGTPGRAPRPTTLYEKAEPTSPTVSHIAIDPNIIERIKISHTPQPESKHKSSSASASKGFTRNSGARATFHFGQARGSKHRSSSDCESGVAYNFAPPHSADDTKPAARIGFFSKLTARFGRRTLQLHDKDYGEHRKNVTK